jgi:hypothetical protein
MNNREDYLKIIYGRFILVPAKDSNIFNLAHLAHQFSFRWRISTQWSQQAGLATPMLSG